MFEFRSVLPQLRGEGVTVIHCRQFNERSNQTGISKTLPEPHGFLGPERKSLGQTLAKDVS